MPVLVRNSLVICLLHLTSDAFFEKKRNNGKAKSVVIRFWKLKLTKLNRFAEVREFARQR